MKPPRSSWFRNKSSGQELRTRARVKIKVKAKVIVRFKVQSSSIVQCELLSISCPPVCPPSPSLTLLPGSLPVRQHSSKYPTAVPEKPVWRHAGAAGAWPRAAPCTVYPPSPSKEPAAFAHRAVRKVEFQTGKKRGGKKAKLRKKQGQFIDRTIGCATTKRLVDICATRGSSVLEGAGVR